MTILQLVLRLCLALAALINLPTQPQAASSLTIIAVHDLGQAQLKGSKYRHVGRFNTKLAGALAACGKAEVAERISTNGLLNRATAAGIKALRSCPGFDRLES